ncbi:hypothetical protein Tco_0985464 [Tanacetum coccineum]
MDVEKAIAEPRHMIDNHLVNVTKYMGRKGHKDVFVKGTFILRLEEMPTRRTENGTEHDIRRCNVNYHLESLFQSLAYNRIEAERGRALDFSGVAVIRFTNKNDCKKAKRIAKRKLLCKAIMEEQVGEVNW